MTEFSPLHTWSAASPYALALGIAASVCIALAVLGWRRRAQPEGVPFALLMTAAAVWSVFYALELTAPSLQEAVIWAKVEYLGIATLPWTWFLFARRYTGAISKIHWMPLTLITLLPAVTVALAATNELHHLLWTGFSLGTQGPFPMLALAHGPWFWVQIALSYGLLAAGSAVILGTVLRYPRLYRKQAGMLMAGVAAPWIANGVSVFHLLPVGGLDVTPFAFAFTGIVVFLAMSRFRFFSLLPALLPTARSQVIEKMTDGVIVLDADGRVVSVNPAAGHMLGGLGSSPRGRLVSEVLGADCPPFVGQRLDSQFEVSLREGASVRNYDVVSSALGLGGNLEAGRLLVLRDITERKYMEARLVRSEEHFRALIENSSDLVAVIDQNGIVKYQSSSSESILGYRPEELVGGSAFSFICEADIEQARQRLSELVSGGREESHSTELRFRHKDGSWRVLEVKGRRLTEPGGAPSFILNSRDMTERQEMEESLRLAQYSVEGAADLINWIDQEGRILFANEACCRRGGYSVEEMLSLHVNDLDASLTAEGWQEVWQSLVRLGSLTDESTFRTKSGEVYPVEVSATHIKQGGKDYCFSFARDISERVEALQALRHSEERYRVLVDTTSDLIFSFDSDLRLTGINRAAAGRLGLATGPALGTHLFDFPLPKEVQLRWEEECKKVLATGMPAGRLVGEFMMADLQMHMMETHLSPITSADGSVIGVRGVARDFTERFRAETALRDSEARYRALFDSANDGVIVHALDGRIFEANRIVTERVGFTRQELLAMNLSDIRAPGAEHYFAAQMQAVVDSGSAIFETQHRGADGSVVPVEVSSRLLDGADVGAVLSISRDISERKRNEEALALAEDQLRQAQKMEAVGQLAGGIAHDFNNLLTAIIGNSELVLQTTPLNDPNRELVADVKGVGERAAALTHQILAFSRRQMLKPEVFCLNEGVRRIEPLLARTLGEDIQLQVILSPDLRSAEVDPSQLEQVLMNLAVNARDAMPHGGGLVIETANVVLDSAYCVIRPELQPGAHVMLAVSDTGHGMDADTRARIFEPFFTTKEVGKGTGLGLSTVFGIVKQSGGSISVYSERGNGTSFKIYLPVHQGADRPQDEPAPRRQPTWGNETILVVEDEAPVRRLVARVLLRSGYRVLEAGCAAEADALLAGPLPSLDLLLSDVVLPGGRSGHQVAEAVHESHPGLPVIFMSGYTQNSAVFNGSLGPDADFMEKPFTPDGLLAKVRDALDEAASGGNGRYRPAQRTLLGQGGIHSRP